jgi:hypothetical protein
VVPISPTIIVMYAGSVRNSGTRVFTKAECQSGCAKKAEIAYAR